MTGISRRGVLALGAGGAALAACPALAAGATTPEGFAVYALHLGTAPLVSATQIANRVETAFQSEARQ